MPAVARVFVWLGVSGIPEFIKYFVAWLPHGLEWAIAFVVWNPTCALALAWTHRLWVGVIHAESLVSVGELRVLLGLHIDKVIIPYPVVVKRGGTASEKERNPSIARQVSDSHLG